MHDEDRRADSAAARPTQRLLLDAHEAFIVGMIAERKDITLNEMVERLKAEWSVRISRSAEAERTIALWDAIVRSSTSLLRRIRALL